MSHRRRVPPFQSYTPRRLQCVKRSDKVHGPHTYKLLSSRCLAIFPLAISLDLQHDAIVASSPFAHHGGKAAPFRFEILRTVLYGLFAWHVVAGGYMGGPAHEEVIMPSRVEMHVLCMTSLGVQTWVYRIERWPQRRQYNIHWKDRMLRRSESAVASSDSLWSLVSSLVVWSECRDPIQTHVHQETQRCWSLTA